jgi:predicted nucleotidyltransferase
MDVSRPYTALGPTLDTGVLSVLAGTTRPLTGREIARLLGRHSHSGVLDALHRLTEHGLVDREEAGRAFLFALNREHLAAPAAELLARMGGEFFNRLAEAIDSWEIEAVHVSLFGSMARGDGDTSSDIDLFIVRPEGVEREDAHWREQLDLLARKVQRWTGNQAGVAEVGKAELSQLRERDPLIVNELRADAVTVAGPEAATLLGDT